MMKKVLMVMAAAMVFAACEKKEECKTCTQYTRTYWDGEIQDEMTSETEYGKLCGDQLEQVDGQTIDSEINMGGMTVKTEVYYVCK